MSQVLQFTLQTRKQAQCYITVPCFSWDKNGTQEIKEKTAEAIQRSSLTQSLHLKVYSSQQGASSSGISPRGADSISQPREAEKTAGSRDSPFVRNLSSLPIKITSLGASSSGTPPQGASSSSKPVEEGDLQHVASKVGRLHMAKTKLSGSSRRSFKI
jgi:hypothetical protein